MIDYTSKAVSRASDSADAAHREYIERERACMRSLLAFREAYFPARDDVKPAPFHEIWSDILLRGRGHFAIEAFRESAKTQIVIRANLLHALAYPMDGREYIIIICATQRTASKKLTEVSRELQAMPELMGSISKIREDSGLALEVVHMDGHVTRIEAYGKGAAVRGLSWGSKRPDLIIIDDPQDEEDARSETVTATDWEWFLSDVLFLGQSSRIFLIGNNLGERCIIEQIMRNPSDLNFTAARMPILTPDGTSAWPEKWPIDKIRNEKASFARLGQLDIWYRNKMCECISPDSQKFKRDYFRYYEFADVKLDSLNIYTSVDLAISNKSGADYSAIVTVGVNSDGHWLVLDVEYGRYDPTTTMDAIFSAVAKWRPLAVGIECVAYQSALQHFLEKEMPKRGQFFRIQPLKAQTKKELRIDSLQPRFAVGSVWFKARAPWLEKIESELLAYPHGAHDDVIDALAYMEQMTNSPQSSGVGGGDWSLIRRAGSI